MGWSFLDLVPLSRHSSKCFDLDLTKIKLEQSEWVFHLTNPIDSYSFLFILTEKTFKINTDKHIKQEYSSLESDFPNPITDIKVYTRISIRFS